MDPRRPLVLAATLTTVLVATAGCVSEPSVNARPHVGTGTASEVAGVQQITLRSGLDLRFTPATIVVHRGMVRLVLVNVAKPGAGPPHDVTFAGLPIANVPTTDAGRESSVSFVAPAPGTYQFVCSIHARQGQTGTLIVRK
jgi:plastocyanin